MKVCLLIVGLVALATGIDSADPECAYRKALGLAAHWGNPTDCSRFYRCTNRGVKREILCTADKEYNAKTGKCVNRARGLCKLTTAAPLADADNVCLDALDGSYQAQSDNCRDFYVCHDKVAYPQTCDAGSAFNAEKGVCEPDPESVCWQNQCIGRTDGSFVPNADDCTAYYICNTQEAVAQQCPAGSYFNAVESNCQPGECPGSVTTEPPPAEDTTVCTCPGGYEEGEFVKHPDSCNLYYICSDRRLELQDCGAGNFFDATLMACQVDVAGVCPEESNNDDSEAALCECPSDNLWAVPDACNMYYACDGDTKIEKQCAAGSLFDESVSACRVDTTGSCEAAAAAAAASHRSKRSVAAQCSGGHVDGDFVADSEDCSRFKICHDGKLLSFSCGEGNFFSATQAACLSDVNNECRPAAEKPSPHTGEYSCPSEMQWPAQQCNQFQACNGSVEETRSCPAGFRFSNLTYTCSFDADNACPAAGCSQLANGTTIMNVDACNQYYVCRAGERAEAVCPAGYYFDTTVSECLVDTSGSCSSSVSGLCDGRPEGYTFTNPSACNRYFQCRNGLPTDALCPSGYFYFAFTGLCQPDTTGICTVIDETASCTGQPDGTTYPVADNDTAFVVCINGEAVTELCPAGTTFSTLFNTCTGSNESDCDQSQCSGSNDYYAFPTNNPDTEPNAFCRCLNGSAIKQYCPAGFDFNDFFGVCLSNSPCDPDLCASSPDNTVSENPQDPHSFCLCQNGEAVVIECPEDAVFMPQVEVCRPQDPHCDPYHCMDQPEDTVFGALNTTAGFCVCQMGSARFILCEEGTSFNSQFEVCLASDPSEGECDNAQCTQIGLNFPLANETTLYCHCSGVGVAEVLSCPPDMSFSTEFFVCLTDCKEGEEYNPSTEQCEAVVGECDNKACVEADIDFPFPGNQSMYCHCEDEGLAVPQECPPNNLFNLEFFVCLPNCPENTVYNELTHECLPESTCTCVGGYPEGTILPNKLDCTQFYVCEAGRLEAVSCGAGNFFDATTGACAVDTDGKCAYINANRCVGGYEPGTMVPHPTNPDQYYICEACKLVLGTCGTGVFSEEQQACVQQPQRKARSLAGDSHDEQAGDSEHDELSPCAAEELRSVPSNCSQYESCTAGGKWRRFSCPAQQYYNAEQRVCMEPRDDTVCLYARVQGLPECNASSNSTMHPAKGDACGQYFRCTEGRWRLRSCGRHQFYAPWLQTCIAAPTDEGIADLCAARDLMHGAGTANSKEVAEVRRCRHTSVRHYSLNCAMYLMCLEGEWWYQYCPLGMYFNRTQNYCMPNDSGQCADAAPSFTEHERQRKELAAMTGGCDVEDRLMASAVTCDMYYICLRGEWHSQSCPDGHYYDAASESCAVRSNGECPVASKPFGGSCAANDTRSFPLNCTAFMRCNGTRSEWQRADCPLQWAFDDVLGQCVPNDGTCSASGLRRACVSGERRPLALASNCTQFYYCAEDSWKVGQCLRGDTFSRGRLQCEAHSDEDRCQPLREATSSTYAESTESPCSLKEDGAFAANPADCSRFFVCYQGREASEQQCTVGSFFDSALAYCRPNDGSCRLPLTGVCANATDGAVVANPDDCRSYYNCSTLTGSLVVMCPDGQYFHPYMRQCRVDHGECHQSEPDSGNRCLGVEHGTRLPHEQYCNIFYACVRGLAIPVECADGEQFSAALGRCVVDETHQCQDGQLVNGTHAHSCGNLPDGSYLPDLTDCSRYYICSEAVAVRQRCSAGTYFDAEQLMCVPDDGSCPYVDDDDDEPSHQPVPPDPIVCEGKHGNLLPDPLNCNNFYVCINGKLRHERCYTQHFFNVTSFQCQKIEEVASGEGESAAAAVAAEGGLASAKGPQPVCSDPPVEFAQLCPEIPEDGSIAEQGDCRKYITCPDGEEPLSQRCRNGESYDSLLGFCRQNDGTCLLENGQRVGDCNERHGQLARNTADCRGYYVCIHGQKISGSCADDEYFSKSQNLCQKDVLAQCVSNETATTAVAAEPKVSCLGLSESLLYPHVGDKCRSYFQCVHGEAKVTECADGLYFDANTSHCVKEIAECVMPAPALTNPRSPKISDIHKQFCSEQPADSGRPAYANVEDRCRSFFSCLPDGSVWYTTCPEGLLYSAKKQACIHQAAADVTAQSAELADDLPLADCYF